MDFEEQLEKAEKLPEPSLVGASLRSADDSAHNNYIHPEKYKNKKQGKAKKSTKKSIAASLDDLINEGALLGSEEDFERFLDEEGHVKDDAKYTKQAEKEIPDEQTLKDFLANNPDFSPEKQSLAEFLKSKDSIPNSPVQFEKPAADSIFENKPTLDPNPLRAKASDFYKQEDYSTPNLSEYQLEHQIKDHEDLLSSIQSHDPHKLPKSVDGLTLKDSESGKKEKRVSGSSLKSESHEEAPAGATTLSTSDSIHTPFFHTERSRSRSRSANPSRKEDRSRSRSAVKPHLARGDSYKNTHVDEPSKYELPADLAKATDFNEEEEEEEDDRRTRQSKPTMGESLAKAEAEAEASGNANVNSHLGESFTRDTSLVTTGDYTNFNVDNPSNEFKASDRLYSTRSESSTNYLRSISRSRSRARPNIDSSHENEKNDADPHELVREGALVTDDPYSTIDHLDTMVEEVLHPSSEAKKAVSEQKKNVNFETQPSTESKEDENQKVLEAKDEEKDNHEAIPKDKLQENSDAVEAVPEDKKEGSAPVITAADIKVETNEVAEKGKTSIGEPQIEEVKNEDIADLAADKIENEETEPATASVTADAINVDTKKVEAQLEEEKGIKDADPHEQDVKETEPQEVTELEEVKEDTETKELDDDYAVDPAEEGAELPAKINEEKAGDEADVKVSEKDLQDETSNTETEASEVKEVSTTSENGPREASAPIEKDSDLTAQEDTLVGADEEKPQEVEDSTENPEPKVGAREVALDEPNVSTEEKAEQIDGSEKVEEKSEGHEGSKPDESIGSTAGAVGAIGAAVVAATEAVKSAVGGETEEKDSESKEKASGDAVAAATAATASDDLDDIDVSPEELRKHLESQPIYLYTSLAGGMQIVPRTNRLVTILQANGIKFEYRDLGTDEEAKKIWRRQAAGKPLPGVVRGEDFIGNFKDIEDANEEYQLRELLYETL